MKLILNDNQNFENKPPFFSSHLKEKLCVLLMEMLAVVLNSVVEQSWMALELHRLNCLVNYLTFLFLPKHQNKFFPTGHLKKNFDFWNLNSNLWNLLFCLQSDIVCNQKRKKAFYACMVVFLDFHLDNFGNSASLISCDFKVEFAKEKDWKSFEKNIENRGIKF